MLKVGEKAPDFLGVDDNGNEIRVSDYAGRRLVVYFYPKDSTPGWFPVLSGWADA